MADIVCLRPLSLRFEQEVSPTSGVPRTSSISNVSPTDHRVSSFGNYRRDLAVLETSGGRSIPQIQHNPPTAASPNPIAPWMSSNTGSPVVPSSIFGTSFYNDSSDALSQGSQLSPGFRPGTGRTANTSTESPEPTYFDDNRRPSVASITTASSSGSKSSAVRTGIHKSLKGFFGEDFPGREGSETSLPAAPNGKELKDQRSNSYSRNRNHSTATETNTARDSSPVPSRPRTPVPSSDVVPFLYQDSQVSTPSSHPNMPAYRKERYINALSSDARSPLFTLLNYALILFYEQVLIIVANRIFRSTEKLRCEDSYQAPIKDGTCRKTHKCHQKQHHLVARVVRIEYIFRGTITDTTKAMIRSN